MFLLSLLACGSSVPSTDEPSAVQVAPAVRPASVRVPSPKPSSNGAGRSEEASVYLEFTGLSPLHQGFFQDVKMVASLGEALSSCVNGPVVLAADYDTPTRVGVLELHVDRAQLKCVPSMDGEALALAPWVSIGRSLAAYRDAVAGRYDLRLGSFRTRLRLTRQVDACTFELTGQYPPDGTTWSPCVRFGESGGDCVVDRSVGVESIERPSATSRKGLEACLGD